MELKALSRLQCQNGSDDNYVKLPAIALPRMPQGALAIPPSSEHFKSYGKFSKNLL